jgi:hypothetical protein
MFKQVLSLGEIVMRIAPHKSDDPKHETWVSLFFEYWNKRCNEGKSSELYPIEECAIWIFAEWLEQRCIATKRKKRDNFPSPSKAR